MKGYTVIRPIAFLSVLCVMLLGISQILESYNYKKNDIVQEPENTIDYLVIGDSESYTSVSPMQIYKEQGYTGYNLGRPGQRLQDTYFYLEQALEKQKPKLLLFETNAIFRKNEFLDEMLKIGENSTKRVFPVFEIHNTWKDMIKNGFEKVDYDQQEEASKNGLKGFRYNVKQASYTKGEYVKKSDAALEIGSVQKDYLFKIFSLCKENDIKIILYSAPSPENWKFQKHNAIKKIAEKEKIDYLDFNLMNDKIKIDWKKDTYDQGDHLNYYGAVKVSRLMGEYLYKTGYLQSRKQNEDFSHWEKALVKYESLVKGS